MLDNMGMVAHFFFRFNHLTYLFSYLAARQSCTGTSPDLIWHSARPDLAETTPVSPEKGDVR